MRLHKFSRWLLLIYLLSLFILVFWPRFSSGTAENQESHGVIKYSVSLFNQVLYADNSVIMLANIVMLLPLPVLLKLSFKKISKIRIFILGLSLSCFIELTQYFIPGRVSDWRDILSNGAGLLIGIYIVSLFPERKFYSLNLTRK